MIRMMVEIWYAHTKKLVQMYHFFGMELYQCLDLQSIFSEDALKLKCPKCALKINFRAPQQLWRCLRDHFLPLN